MPKKEYINFLVNKWSTNKISDLYVYFFLKTFDLLSPNGKHVFLCSDTWIKSGYGDSIKNKIEEFDVEKIISSPYDVFFPEGTNAIITILSNNKTVNNTTLSYYDGFNNEIFCEINLKNLLKNKKRNQILVYPYYKKNQNNSTTCLSDFISGQTSNITFKKIKDIAVTGEENKLFYQDQARINKPALYKNNILIDELKYSVPNEFFQNNKYKVSGGVFLASMLDRLPLLFWTDGFETIHTSKYYFLKPKKVFNYKLIYFLLINPITLIDLEINCKDSTNRSLRIGEQGFAKELDLKEVLKLKTIDLNSLSESTINEMLEYIENWESNVEFNIENVYSREDYINVMNLIYEDLNFEDMLQDINTSLHLYRKRMRNINYRFEYL
jgi:type I restriction-modification system DNA methylase subunit